MIFNLFVLIFFPRKFQTNQSAIEFLFWFLNWEFDGKSKSFTTLNSQQESLFLIIFCVSLMSLNLDWWSKSRLQKYYEENDGKVSTTIWRKTRGAKDRFEKHVKGTAKKSFFFEIITKKKSKLLKHSVQTTVFFQASFGTTP